jgi:hypothetical protein
MATVTTPSPAVTIPKRRIVDSWRILGTATVRYECGHEYTMFDPPPGWPQPLLFRDAILGCEECAS